MVSVQSLPEGASISLHRPISFSRDYAAVLVQEVLRAILANWSFLVRLKEGLSYGERPRIQEMWVFSCIHPD